MHKGNDVGVCKCTHVQQWDRLQNKRKYYLGQKGVLAHYNRLQRVAHSINHIMLLYLISVMLQLFLLLMGRATGSCAGLHLYIFFNGIKFVSLTSRLTALEIPPILHEQKQYFFCLSLSLQIRNFKSLFQFLPTKMFNLCETCSNMSQGNFTYTDTRKAIQ